ncbi:MAG: PAS domain S-box protein, partial [Methanoregula sp.]|nr:PAS domain S-box protein [Methanoregula sp.]
MVSILYVDDEGDLLELGKLFLERSPDFHVETALSAKAALASPAITSFDAIVSDYQMPDMDGIAFLKLVRERFGDIPFILFTGRGREDVVIDAINHGADFYIQKGGDVKAQFAELSHKIRQAVARRKAEHSLVESEKRLTDIINFLPDATVAINREGVIIAWNREMEELTGVSAATMLGKGDYEYALPFYGERRPLLLDLIFEPDDVIEQKYSNIVRDNDALIADTTLSHLHGREVTLFGKASPLYNTRGEIVGAIEAIRDITGRKKSEDELRAAYEQITASDEELRGQLDALEESEQRIKENASRLRFMLGFYDKADDDKKALLNFAVEGAGTITSSPLGYLAFLNDDESELSMYAWSKSAMKECSLQEKPIVYKTAKTGLWGEAVRQRQPVITNDYAAPSPVKKGYPSGHPEIVRHMNIPVLDGGHIVLVSGVANKSQDYTDDDVEQLSLLMQGLWQVLKQRQIKQELFESEEQYRDLFENSVVGIFQTTPEGKFLALNATLARIAGYDSPQEMLAALQDLRTQLYVNPEDRDRFVAILRTDGFVKGFEVRYYHRDGHEIWTLVNARAVRDSQGKVRYFEGTIDDITEQKRAEDALKKSDEKFRDIIESSPDLIWEMDAQGVFTYMSPQSTAILGYSPEQMVGKPLFMIIPEDALSVSKEIFAKGVQTRNQLLEFDSPARRSDGTLIIMGIRAVPLTDAKGKFCGFRGITRDITEKKNAADELRAAYEQLTASDKELHEKYDELGKSENRIRESEENYRTIVNSIQDVFYRSDTRGNLVMASPSTAELLGYDSLDEVIGKNIAKEFWFLPEQRQKFIDELEKHGAVKNFEAVLRRKDGRPVTVATSSHFYYAKDGSVAGIEGIFHDITAIKEADQQIHLLASLIDLSPASITVHDSEGRIIYANQRSFDLHGYTREEFMALNLHEIDVPASEELINQRITSLKQTGIVSFDVEHFRKDGSHLPLHVMAQMTRWNDRDVILSVATDRSERIVAERILFEREEQYRKLFEQSNDAIFVADPKTQTITDCNRKAELMTGYSRSEILGMPVATLHPEDVRAGTMEHFQKFLEGMTNSVESALLTRDGRRVEVSVNAGPIEVGGQILLIGTFRDITGQKQVEEALREGNLKLNLLSSITRHDVANQLTILQGYVQIAAMEKSNPFIADYLAKIISSANIITRQIEFTRMYQELGVKAPVWIRIETVIGPGEIVVPVVYSGTCKGVEIFADPMLERVFFNLFDNAVRHGTHVTEITIRCERAPGGIVVLVEDNGTGIAATDKEKIFGRGVGRHTGLGLFLVREILSITGITIKETGIYGQGARFEIFVPEGKYR